MLPSDCHASWQETQVACDVKTATGIPTTTNFLGSKHTGPENHGDVAVDSGCGREGAERHRISPSGTGGNGPCSQDVNAEDCESAVYKTFSDGEVCADAVMQSCAETSLCVEIKTRRSGDGKLDTPLSAIHLDTPLLDSQENQTHWSDDNKLDTPLSANHINTPLSVNHLDTPQSANHLDTPLSANHLDTPLLENKENSSPCRNTSSGSSPASQSAGKEVEHSDGDCGSFCDSVGDLTPSADPRRHCGEDIVHGFESSFHGQVSFCVDENQNIASDSVEEKQVKSSVSGVRHSDRSKARKGIKPVAAKKMLPLRPSQSHDASNGVDVFSSKSGEELQCSFSNPLLGADDTPSLAMSRLTLEHNSGDSGSERMTQSCIVSHTHSDAGIEVLPFELTQSDIVLRPSSTEDHMLRVSSVPSEGCLGASTRTLTSDLFGRAESDFSVEQSSLRDIESLPASELDLTSSLQAVPACSHEASPLLASSAVQQAESVPSLEAGSGGSKESPPLSQEQQAGGADPTLCESETTFTVCSVNMEEVPDEVFLKIFSFLTHAELCRHVTRVCKQWRRLAYDATLWRKLDLSAWRATGAQLQQIVLRVPGAVRYLDISAMDSLTLDDVAVVSVNCPELTYLDAGFVDDFTSDMLYLILMNCPKLRFLNVEGCRGATHEMMMTLAKTSGPQLQQLNFSHCSLTDDSLTLMMNNMAGITHLNIDGISWISDRVVRQLAVTYADTLESLELDGNDLSDSSMEAVCQCQRLHTLSVSFCEDLTDLSVKHLLRLQRLEKLVLRKGLGLSAGAVTQCFTSSVMRNLTYLDLTECQQLTDQGVHAIAQCCGGNLRTLILAWCWVVTDRGVEAIAQHCLGMERLYLTGLHRLEGAWLPEAVRNMKHLVYITFEQCNEVADAVIEEAVRDKQDLVILNYYGEVFIHRRQQ